MSAADISDLPPPPASASGSPDISDLPPPPQADAKAPTSPLATRTQQPAPEQPPKDDRTPQALVSWGSDLLRADVRQAAQLVTDPYGWFTGLAESQANMLEGAGKSVIAGLSPIFTMDLGSVARTKAWLDKHIPDVPENAAGKDISTVMSAPFSATHAAGEQVFEATGSPAAATAAEAVPDAAMMLFGEGLRRAPKTPAQIELTRQKAGGKPPPEGNPTPNARAPEQVAEAMSKDATSPVPTKPLDKPSDLDDFLHQQSTLHAVDKINAGALGDAAGKAIDPAQQVELHHHVEKPGTGAVTPATLDFYARYLKPVEDAIHKVAQDLKLRGWGEVDDEQAAEGGGVGYVHRERVGKSPLLDAAVSGEDAPKGGVGGFFSRKASSMFKRKMMALEDENGNRQVVHMGGGRVTGFTDKTPTDLGPKQMKPVEDLMKGELAPLQEKHDKLRLEASVLERYQGKQSKASRQLSAVNERISDIDDQRDIARQSDRIDQRIKELEIQQAALEPLSGDTRLTRRLQQIRDDIATARDTQAALVEAKRALDPERWDATLAEWEARAKERTAGLKGEGRTLRRVQEPDRIRKALDRIDQKIESLRRKRAAVGFMKFDPVEQARLAELHVQRNTLAKAAETYNPGRRRLLNVRSKMEELEKSMDKIRKSYEDRGGRVFVDKTGKQWKVRDATTKEIEQHTDIQYHKNYTASLLKNYVELMKKKRMADALDAIKNSPLARDRMMEKNSGKPPDKDWRAPNVPAFQNYMMDPRLAEMLEDYYGQKGGLEEVMEKISKAIIAPMFLNPLPHIWNGANHAIVEQGFFGTLEKLYPPNGVKYAKNWEAARKDVLTQSPLYMEVMRNGGSLMYGKSVLSNNWNKYIGSAMREAVIKEPSFVELAKSTGRAPIDAYNAMIEKSNSVLWAASDMMMMRAIREHMDKGMSVQEAIKHSETHIPNYRVPSRVLFDNQVGRALSQIMRSPAATAFGRYHYGVWRSYSNMVKDIIGKDVPMKDRARAMDQLLMLGVVTYVAYPMADAILRKLLHNKNARFIRSGASRIPDLITQIAKGEKDFRSLPLASMTPAPGAKSALELMFNKDLFTGKDIRNEHAGVGEQIRDLSTYGVNQVAPTQWSYAVATGKKSLWQEILQQVGVDAPTEKQVENKEKYRRKEATKERHRRLKRELSGKAWWQP